jgi:alpha-D-ribose 1-methylphosphonate 5-triphosphate diphosphatase
VIAAGEVFAGSVRLTGGAIAAVDRGRSGLAAAEDCEGDYLLPGLVEIHTDDLERHLGPRPGVRWPSLAAAVAHDSQVVSAGITTVFEAVTIADMVGFGDLHRFYGESIEAVKAGREAGVLRADHRLHLRCEVASDVLMERFSPLAEEPLVGIVSLMDHTPGQRQFADLGKFRAYYRRKHGLGEKEMDARLAEWRAASARLSGPNRDAVAAICRDRGLQLASHDDATIGQVEEAAALGAVIAEFPTTVEAAKAARARGMSIVMGAPNLIRGRSHTGNVEASALASQGLLDILSSDYYPSSLLHAAFAMTRMVPGISLPPAVAMVTENPAWAAGLHDRGQVAPGCRADLVRVRDVGEVPLVRGVWRDGERVF